MYLNTLSHIKCLAVSQFAYYPSEIVFENRISMSQIIVGLKNMTANIAHNTLQGGRGFD